MGAAGLSAFSGFLQTQGMLSMFRRFANAALAVGPETVPDPKAPLPVRVGEYGLNFDACPWVGTTRRVEAPGLAAVILGLATAGDDEHTLRASAPLFDGLLRLYSQSR